MCVCVACVRASVRARDTLCVCSADKSAVAKGAHKALWPQCPHCEYSTPKAGNLSQHIAAKHTDVSFVCDEPGCGKSYKLKVRLDYHKRTHSGEGFVCAACGESFASVGKLGVHRRKFPGGMWYARLVVAHVCFQPSLCAVVTRRWC